MKFSQPISNQLGVNQGGVVSGLLFPEYIQGMNAYLKEDEFCVLLLSASSGLVILFYSLIQLKG